MNTTTYESWSRAVSMVLKVVGIVGIIFVPVFWAFTDRVELAFCPFFASLTTAGLGIDVLQAIAKAKVQLPPTNDDQRKDTQ